MTDRETVIAALEYCAVGTKYCHGCPMKDDCKGVSNGAMAAAIELLKAQEPVEPWTHIDITPEGTSMVINCGACHQELAKAQRGVPLDCIQEQVKYCMRCGKKVKWNA